MIVARVRCEGTLIDVANVIYAARRYRVIAIVSARREGCVRAICRDLYDASGSNVEVEVEAGAYLMMPSVRRFDATDALHIVCDAIDGAAEAFHMQCRSCPEEATDVLVTPFSDVLQRVRICPDDRPRRADATLNMCMECEVCRSVDEEYDARGGLVYQ